MKTKIAVITGGSKGIGKSLVSKYLSENYKVITCSRSRTEFDKTFRTQDSPQLEFLETDISKISGLNDFITFVEGQTDQVDVLINNAGVFLPGDASKGDTETMNQLMDLNFWAPFKLTTALLPRLEISRVGHIFNICSVANLGVYPPGNLYAISKYALYGYSRALRDELRKTNIRVTTVHPGPTMSASWVASGIDENRLADPVDVAETIFNSSQLSSRSVVEEIIIRPQEGDLD